MGLFDNVFKGNKELEIMYDWDLIEQKAREVTIKLTAIESILGRIAHTIAMSDIYVKKDDERIKNDLFYRLNVMPNLNQSKNDFLYEIVMRMLRDGECLVIKNDTNDLLIADDFEVDKKAVFENVYRNVVVDDYAFKRNFYRSEVLHFPYSNNSLDKLMNGLYDDYGELLGRMIEFQLKKSQLRATVDIDATFAKTEEGQKQVNNFIQKVYSAVKNGVFAIIPQQKGLEYKEHSRETGNVESVDEVKKVKSQYMHDVANSVGYPIAFLNGDIAEIDKITKNYLKFTIDPIVDIIENEMTKQLFTSKEYLDGSHIEVKRVTQRDIFDLVGTGSVNGNELRDSIGMERANDEMLDEYYMSKDYKKSLKGGDDE